MYNYNKNKIINPLLLKINTKLFKNLMITIKVKML
jgi:hypothetical protein